MFVVKLPVFSWFLQAAFSSPIISLGISDFTLSTTSLHDLLNSVVFCLGLTSWPGFCFARKIGRGKDPSAIAASYWIAYLHVVYDREHLDRVGLIVHELLV